MLRVSMCRFQSSSSFESWNPECWSRLVCSSTTLTSSPFTAKGLMASKYLRRNEPKTAGGLIKFWVA